MLTKSSFFDQKKMVMIARKVHSLTKKSVLREPRLQRLGLQCYIKSVVLFKENSILLLPERLEASGVESVWGEVSQESQKNR